MSVATRAAMALPMPHHISHDFPPCPCAPMSLDGSAETWPSGRRRSPAKGVDGKPSRGFESHRLRHFSSNFQKS